jgi:hypothetical protein
LSYIKEAAFGVLLLLELRESLEGFFSASGYVIILPNDGFLKLNNKKNKEG